MWPSSDLQRSAQGHGAGSRFGVASGCWFGVASRCQCAVASLPPLGVVVARTTNRPAPRGHTALLWRPWSRAARGTRLQLCDPPLEEALLALRARELQRALERFAGLIGPAEPEQQLPAR